MEKHHSHKVWFFWVLLSIIVAFSLSLALFLKDDKSVFMPGEMTSGHHQIGMACDSCHGADGFNDAEVMQQTCLDCHGDMRKKPFDSHPAAKFKDPRNAELLEDINALECRSCHSEHRPEATLENGLTQPADFCVACHTEVGDNRPSHKGMGFETCNDAGCHNYHNNRALYTNFLIDHLGEPAMLETPKVKAREFGDVLDQLADYPHDSYPATELTVADADAPATVTANDEIHQQWAGSAHAEIGANCTSCHVVQLAGDEQPVWHDKPGSAGCASCHAVEVKHFGEGKHGMRLKSGISPMTPALARLPMHDASSGTELTCNTCHGAHDYSLQRASVEVCMDCHADEHTLAYKDSKHYQSWLDEQSGEAEEGTGVSCATCHMPKESLDVSDWLTRVVVHHNQNASLSPNEKMLRPACLNCHGLEFSLSALGDDKQIRSNFQGQPDIEVKSMNLARDEKERIARKNGD